MIYGQAVYRMAEQLKTQGFVPDVIYGHSVGVRRHLPRISIRKPR